MLDLPKEMSPVAENIVAAREEVSGEFARWRLEAGGRNRFPLRIVPTRDLDPNRKVNQVRQATTYDVSLSGVNISSQMTLDIPDIPVRRMVLELDPGVRLISARCGETSLSWTNVPPPAQGRRPWAVLEFPEPIRGTGRIVRVGAMASAEVGCVWRLPRLEPREMFWQDGAVAIQVPAPLFVERGRRPAHGRCGSARSRRRTLESRGSFNVFPRTHASTCFWPGPSRRCKSTQQRRSSWAARRC